MARSLTSQQMHELLAREFANARAPGCHTCRVPRTFWGPAAGPGASGYWYMEMPNRCDKGCREMLSRVWAQITTDYSIAPPPRDVIIERRARTG
jgi:hypothetical protein